MKIQLLIMILVTLAIASCSTSKDTAKGGGNTDNQAVSTAPVAPIRATQSTMAATQPRALAFRINGNYADNVMVRLDANGKFLYYPAVSDISENSSSLPIGDGRYLDRQGGACSGTAFLKYTYAEYAALAKTPTLAELKVAIIPGAKVTEVRQLPLTPAEAEANPSALKQYLKSDVQTVEIRRIEE